MKCILILAALMTAPLALASDDHAKADSDHHHGDHAKAGDHHHAGHFITGPAGGQIVKSAAGYSIEVVVDKQRKARITMLDEQGKAAAPGEVAIHGIAGERSKPVKLSFAKGQGEDSGVLISNEPLPAGDHVPMILVIKTRPDAKAVTERFELHLD